MEEWNWCIKCNDEEVNPKRWALGYKTCLSCGGVVAQEQKKAREKTVVPAGNKMGYQPIGGRNILEIKQQLIGRTGKGSHS